MTMWLTIPADPGSADARDAFVRTARRTGNLLVELHPRAHSGLLDLVDPRMRCRLGSPQISVDNRYGGRHGLLARHRRAHGAYPTVAARTLGDDLQIAWPPPVGRSNPGAGSPLGRVRASERLSRLVVSARRSRPSRPRGDVEYPPP